MRNFLIVCLILNSLIISSCENLNEKKGFEYDGEKIDVSEEYTSIIIDNVLRESIDKSLDEIMKEDKKSIISEVVYYSHKRIVNNGIDSNYIDSSIIMFNFILLNENSSMKEKWTCSYNDKGVYQWSIKTMDM